MSWGGFVNSTSDILEIEDPYKWKETTCPNCKKPVGYYTLGQKPFHLCTICKKNVYVGVMM